MAGQSLLARILSGDEDLPPLPVIPGAPHLTLADVLRIYNAARNPELTPDTEEPPVRQHEPPWLQGTGTPAQPPRPSAPTGEPFDLAREYDPDTLVRDDQELPPGYFFPETPGEGEQVFPFSYRGRPGQTPLPEEYYPHRPDTLYDRWGKAGREEPGPWYIPRFLRRPSSQRGRPPVSGDGAWSLDWMDRVDRIHGR